MSGELTGKISAFRMGEGPIMPRLLIRAELNVLILLPNVKFQELLRLERFFFPYFLTVCHFK